MKCLQPKPITLLALLRDLVPQRPLSIFEAERIAELQANRLRELLGLTQAKLPDEAISELPRITVRRASNLLVSGLTYWSRGSWTIALNAREPYGRQRFSLAHEFKHVLDHTTSQWLYPEGGRAAEHVADYFAGCLLMPKRYVKRLFGQRLRLFDMAEAFGVSGVALNVRLSQLGLIEPAPRCGFSAGLPGRSYHRAMVRAA